MLSGSVADLAGAALLCMQRALAGLLHPHKQAANASASRQGDAETCILHAWPRGMVAEVASDDVETALHLLSDHLQQGLGFKGGGVNARMQVFAQNGSSLNPLACQQICLNCSLSVA